MTDLQKILVGYILFLIIEIPAFILVVSNADPQITLNLGFVSGIVIYHLIVLSPFVLITIFSFRSEGKLFLKSLSLGFVLWLFIGILPLFLNPLVNNVTIFLLSYWSQVIIGSYLIFRFNLHRGLILFVLFFGLVANLYLLVYGNYLNLKKSTEKNISNN